MVPELLTLALDYYRAPLRYPHLARPEQPLPESFENLIAAFAGALSRRNIEATALALRTSPAVIKTASVFFLRQVLMAPGSDHYRVLGLSPDASEETIRKHYQLLVRIFHPDRSDGDFERDALYTARVNDAYNTLRRPEMRRRYDRHLAAAGRERQSAASRSHRFQSREPVPPGPRYKRPAIGILTGHRRLRLLIATGGLVASAGAALFWWTSPTRQVLQVNPKLADASVAEPSFLRHRESPEPVRRLTPTPKSSPVVSAAPIRQEPRGRAPSPVSAGSDVALLAPKESGTSFSPEKSRDEIREEAKSGLAPHPETQNAAEVEARESKAALDLSLPSERSARQPETGRDDAHSPPGAPTRAGLAHLSGHSREVGEEGAPAIAGRDLQGNTAATGARPLATRKYEREMAVADRSARKTPPASPSIAAAKHASTPADTKERAPQTNATAAEPAKAPPTPPRPEKVAQSPPAVKQQTASQRASPKEGKVNNKAADKAPQPPQASVPGDERPVPQSRERKARRAEAPSKARPPRQSPDNVIARLSRYYRAGDLKGLVSLFTANARVNNGSGISFIRSDYARFFARTAGGRRLSIHNLKWTPAGNGGIIGRGAYRAATKESPDESWRYATGTLQIELAPWKDSYRISKLVH